MSCLWQISVTTRQYSSLAVRHAPAAPVIGSAMNPAMVSGPSRSITSTTASASSHGTFGNGSSSGSKPGLPAAMTGDGDGAERHAVVAGMATDDLPPLGAALAELVAAGQAQRRVGALAAAAGEEDLRETLRAASARRAGRAAPGAARSARSARVGAVRPSPRASRRQPRRDPSRCCRRRPRRPRRGSGDRRRCAASSPRRRRSSVGRRRSGRSGIEQSFTRSVSHLDVGLVVAEHDRQPRARPRHLRHAVLPVVLARTAHRRTGRRDPAATTRERPPPRGRMWNGRG